MTQYIDKSALVAEIEKQIECAKFKAQQAQENNDYVSYVGWSEHFATCGDILKIIDTLEVKEVDLEKEIQKQFDFHKNSDDNSLVKGFVVMNKDGFEYFAKHFFELGISVSNKAQKGE